MTAARIALLPDRGVVRVAGEDAEKLLQGIITNDMALLADRSAIHASLLTPQGKILFEFFVVKATDGFLLDTGREQADGLIKRLMMYKLRAKVDIADANDAYRVYALWGPSVTGPGETSQTFSFRDPRLPALGLRILAEAGFAADVASASNGFDASLEDYHAHRIALGVPEGGKDYAFGDSFPHEANFDVLGGISFTKGCFVGQEVVSRMQHRGLTRKRIVIVEGDRPLQSGTEITAGAATVGAIGSVAGNRGLALLRLDRAEEATGKGEPLIAAGSRITMRLPDYLKPAREAAAS